MKYDLNKKSEKLLNIMENKSFYINNIPEYLKESKTTYIKKN